MTLSLSRADLLRPEAETRIDRHFAGRIDAVIGPLGALHLVKRMQATTGGGVLAGDDAEAILARAGEQDAELARLDGQRRDMKASVRAARTAAEINTILATLTEQT